MHGRIRKSFGPLSSGTRCEITRHFHKDGTAEVKVGPFSQKFYEQNHPLVREMKANADHVVIPLDLIELTRDSE